MRYYNSSTGRFISEDPIGLAGGDHNIYRYVFNNPLVLKDAYGLAVGDWWDLYSNIMRSYEIGQEELKKRNTNAHNNISDALRHAEWQRRSTIETNSFTALLLGTGNEIKGFYNWLRNSNRPSFSKFLREVQMDLHNNMIGRNAGIVGSPVDISFLDTIDGGNVCTSRTY
ncbi:MAG: hypothetical protein BM556_11430 [Bacteriovorax sp. MedPE-SWde]|nr:MAG: hypothetical protein BM556_11430 [Bacteriovorax sp. MedPE-SWde]